MSAKDSSLLPFLALAAIVYIIFYIFFNSLFKNGTPYIPHSTAKILTADQEEPIQSTIDPLGNPNFYFQDTLNTEKPIEISGWYKIKKDLSQKDVETILGKPSSIAKGLTELWYYNNKNLDRGSVLFYKNKVVNWSIPGFGNRY